MKCKTDLEISIHTNEFLKIYFLILSSLKRLRSDHIAGASGYLVSKYPFPIKGKKTVDSQPVADLRCIHSETGIDCYARRQGIVKQKEGCSKFRKFEGQKEE